MKRFIVSLVVVAGALLSACTQTSETIQPVGLSGTYDLVLVGDLLFVTSADSDELRALQLSTEVTERKFVQAPNPLEALSIPVLERPQALARDERYDENGAERSGSYVFARSSGSTQISVVGAFNRPDRLKELARLDTKGLTADKSSGPVTAFAARAADVAEGEEGGSTLYFATQEGDGGRLWQVQLPAPAELLAVVQQSKDLCDSDPPNCKSVSELLSGNVKPLPEAGLPTNVSVSSILVLPQPEMIAVATRGTAGGATLGTSFTVELGTGMKQELKFGAQVLQLATHGKVTYTDRQNVSKTLEAGERIFGVLDASSCGGALQCTGVLAVQAREGGKDGKVANGEVLSDVSGYPMMAINAGSGLPTGLSLSTDTNLIQQPGEPVDLPVPKQNPGDAQTYTARDRSVPLLGIVPLSNGEILFFDGVNLAPFNVNANNVTTGGIERAVNEATFTRSLIRATGTAAEDTGDIEVATTYGVTRSQTYLLTYESVLPGMEALAIDEGAFRVPYQPRGAAKGQVVEPGDHVVLLLSATSTQACTDGELTVVSVLPPSGDEARATLVTSGAIPAACSGYGFFQVRASGDRPLVLSTAGEDYLQRLGVNETFSRTGTYFFHPEGYMGQSENLEVSIRVTSLSRGTLLRGARYVVTTQANYFPYVITVDTVNFAGLRSFRLPGPVVYWKPPLDAQGNQPTGYAYIVYPSASGVLEVDLTNIDASVANSRGVVPYR
ncbi:hypothetical protein [Archangium sp.]|uniref:hypothetical protein n=1 Tax=Archangium sp. TaxID=1872627 RepID=UPI00389A74E0